MQERANFDHKLNFQIPTNLDPFKITKIDVKWKQLNTKEINIISINKNNQDNQIIYIRQ